MIGYIHSYQTLGTVDGPGVRFVLFMQGCFLRCPYCHNPDTWEIKKEKQVTDDEVLEKIKRYLSYYKDGGVTISGGEPLLQSPFVYSLFKKLKENNLHTALDTSGTIFNEDVKKVLSVTDLVLLDIKFSSNEKYQKYINQSLSTILNFLDYLEKNNIKTIIRQVIVPTINNNKEDILALREIVNKYKCIQKVELLPFKKLCIEKYEQLKMPFPFVIYPEESDEDIKLLYSYFK